eukprot:CAMPEP_0168261610 /NCGR_PEP_ID=MMETSP0141_2-20121125/9173_1 /TAXON_ID=44445 /ORGANISM="Pseudo-nitzschia australis, Strain 10249 10 AB" /LENGTH=693 /DNA_ID=CAMNT_0008199775 /DNA_START=114 /DNA_END=2195 /DNA_ORIENTATION=-
MNQAAPFDEINRDVVGTLSPGDSNDVFDGIEDAIEDAIEDVYDDLETVLHSPATSPTTLEILELEPIPFFCGADPPKVSSLMSKLWFLPKFSNYFEMVEDDSSGREAVPNARDTGDDRKVRVMENGENQEEIEVKNIRANDNNQSGTVKYRETIIQYTINQDVDKIRQKKVKQYRPSFWHFMGQRKIFGLSYRLIFWVLLNLFVVILLIIMVARFKRIDETGADTLPNESVSNESISTESISTEPISTEPISTDIKTDSTEQPLENLKSELLTRCDGEGITLEDGIILTPNQVMVKGEYFCSPSKTYMIVMIGDLAIVDIQTNRVVWSAGVTEGAQTIMEENGIVIIENDKGEVLWSTGPIPMSTGLIDLQMVFGEKNEGLIAIQQVPTSGVTRSPSNFWMDGIGGFEYCDDCPKDNLEFPVRGTFYYPTYDGTEMAWRDEGGNLPAHSPMLGFYSSSDPDVARAHVEDMEYAKIDLAISSWEGPGTNFDRSRMLMLMEETSKQNAALKWTIYHEAELLGRLSPEEIQSDLEYLKKWFAGQDTWAHIGGKPVIYVNNDDGCDAAERWTTGAATDWYVVLRRFNGFKNCEFQPDSWHAERANRFNDGIGTSSGLYYNLVPGEWRSEKNKPNLKRLRPKEWCKRVQNMVDSNEQWQLIVSFNEASHGTSIEPSLDWRSDSPYGAFLDCLHDPQMF